MSVLGVEGDTKRFADLFIIRNRLLDEPIRLKIVQDLIDLHDLSLYDERDTSLRDKAIDKYLTKDVNEFISTEEKVMFVLVRDYYQGIFRLPSVLRNI
jgi:hypothetical protein